MTKYQELFRLKSLGFGERNIAHCCQGRQESNENQSFMVAGL